MALETRTTIPVPAMAPDLTDEPGVVLTPPTPRLFLSTNAAHVDPSELNELLLSSAKTPPRNPAKLRIALDNSYCVVALFADLSGGDESVATDVSDAAFPEGLDLVAFARATSDGAFTATLWDVCVHPDIQSCGMGRAVVERLMGEIRATNVSSFTIFTPPEARRFFESCGFASGARICGMKSVSRTIPPPPPLVPKIIYAKTALPEPRLAEEGVSAAEPLPKQPQRRPRVGRVLSGEALPAGQKAGAARPRLSLHDVKRPIMAALRGGRSGLNSLGGRGEPPEPRDG